MRFCFSKLSIKGQIVLTFFVLFGISMLTVIPANAASSSASEVERYVRARIDIGEGMGGFFKNRKPPQFGPDGGPSMEELRKLEEEINNFITDILSKYDLTIEKYQAQSPEVFSDEAGVRKFLKAHPDLKKRYEVLPQSPRRGRRH